MPIRVSEIKAKGKTNKKGKHLTWYASINTGPHTLKD